MTCTATVALCAVAHWGMHTTKNGCLHSPLRGADAEELQCYAGPSSAAGPSTAAADEDDDDDMVIMDEPSAADADDDVMIVDEVKPPSMAAATGAGPEANVVAGKRDVDADLEGPKKRRKASQ